MTWILANWKVCAIGAAAILFGLLIHHYDDLAFQEEKQRAVTAQQITDTNTCNADKAITKEANDALQKDHDAIAGKLAALELQHPATCIPVASSAKLSTCGAKHAGQNGISSNWLREYAAEAEGYRTEVITCVNFINSALANPSANNSK